MLLLPADVGFDWLDLFRGSNRVKICFVILFFCFFEIHRCGRSPKGGGWCVSNGIYRVVGARAVGYFGGWILF